MKNVIIRNTDNQKSYFEGNDLRTAWTNEYLNAAQDSNVDRIALLKEVRSQQEFEIEAKQVKAKNLSTAAGLLVATGIIFKEYGGVVASKALPMVSRFL